MQICRINANDLIRCMCRKFYSLIGQYRFSNLERGVHLDRQTDRKIEMDWDLTWLVRLGRFSVFFIMRKSLGYQTGSVQQGLGTKQVRTGIRFSVIYRVNYTNIRPLCTCQKECLVLIFKIHSDLPSFVLTLHTSSLKT